MAIGQSWLLSCRPMLILLLLLAAFVVSGRQWPKPDEPLLSCASSQPPGNEACDGDGFCYDMLDIQTGAIHSGCSRPSSLCASSGCFLLPDGQQKFLCCCARPFCNGKSPQIVKARWRQFLKGDYPAKVLRKRPRDVSKELLLQSSTSSTPKSTMAASTAKTTAKGVNITVTAKVTTRKPAASTSSSTKMTTSRVKPMEATTAKPKPVEKPVKKATTVKPSQPVVTTKIPTGKNENQQKSDGTASSTITTMKFMEKIDGIEEKVMELLQDTDSNETMDFFLPRKTTPKPMDISSSTTAKTTPKMEHVTKAVTMQRTTLSVISAATQHAYSSASSTASMATTAAHSSPSTATTSASSSSITTMLRAASTNGEKIVTSPANSQPQSSSITSSSSISTGTTVSRRTTRSPSPTGRPVTPSTTSGWERAIPSFPWYFIALAGFLSSSAIFLLVYWTVAGCRRIFAKRLGTRNANMAEGQAGVPMIPMANGKTGKPKKEKVAKVAKQKRTAAKTNGQMSSKTTNESLASKCTASTTVGNGGGIEEELGTGEQVTVIDPLLNQQYSGNMSK